MELLSRQLPVKRVPSVLQVFGGDVMRPRPERADLPVGSVVTAGYLNMTQAERDAAHDEPSTPEARIRAALLTGDQIKDLPKPDPLIESFLYRNTLAAIFGPSGHGKTFVALSMALAIANGCSWFGQSVTAGSVLYVVAEGATGFGDRVAAWQEHERVPTTGNVSWLPIAVNLSNPGWAGAMRAVVDDKQPDVVVFDTLARNMVGADENSAKDMGVVVEAVDQIRRASDALVISVHHSGKNAENGMRGSSVLKAAVDTELEVRMVDNLITLRTTKQKNAAEPLPRHFRLVTSGPSCALKPHRGALDSSELPEKLEEVVAALRSVQVEGGVSASVWQLASDAPERSFYRARRQLVEAEVVSNVGTDKQPRYIVTATATATANPAVAELPATATPLGVAVGSNGDSGA